MRQEWLLYSFSVPVMQAIPRGKSGGIPCGHQPSGKGGKDFARVIFEMGLFVQFIERGKQVADFCACAIVRVNMRPCDDAITADDVRCRQRNQVRIVPVHLCKRHVKLLKHLDMRRRGCKCYTRSVLNLGVMMPLESPI